MVTLDKDPWQQTDAVNLRTINLTPSIITGSTGLVAKRYANVTEGFVNANGNYMLALAATGQTLTLPASPLIGDTIKITDIANNCYTLQPNIARNGERIQGLLEDLVFDISNGTITLIYSNTTYGWRIVE
jgi:hypothetical protein